MVDWKSSATQLISGIVGSSLLLFGVTTFYTDYLQKPRVEINSEANLIDPDRIDFYDYLSYDYLSKGENETKWSELKYQIQADIVNHGNTPATEVRVTYILFGDPLREGLYIDAHKPIALSQENFTTILEEPTRVTWEIPRLAAGSSFLMNVNVTRNFSGSLISDPLFEDLPEGFFKDPYSPAQEEAFQVIQSYYSPYYVISAAEDHGTTLRSFGGVTRSDVLYEQSLSDINAAIVANTPLIFLSVVSVLIILIPRISIVIKRSRVENEQAKMVSAVHSEIKMVHDALEKDINSKRIFPCNVWYSAPSDLKRQIFDNYDDYISINNFYEELEIRDSLLTAKSEAFRFDNKELLRVSDDILRKINWLKYRMVHFSVPIARTVLSALAVAFCEYLLSISFIVNFGPTFWILMMFPAMTITGAVIAFTLLAKILNIQSIFSKRESSQVKLALPRHMKNRLFVLCLIVGGISPLLFAILTFMFPFDTTADILNSLGLIPVGVMSDFSLTIIVPTAVLIVGGVLTILMMFLSVSYVARKIKKSLQ